MIVNMKCPSCGAQMQFDDSMTSMDCPYCGGKVANLAEKIDITQNVNVSGTIVHVQDRSNEPNLYITYNTNNPSVVMVSRIVSTGVKGSYVNGQTQSFHLSQGPQTIVLKIGKKNYSRDVVIPPDNQPVRIYASFNGRAQISVDQPNSVPPVTAASGAVQPQAYPAAAQPSQPAQPVAPKAPGLPKSPLSILAFVLSLTMYLSWAGIGLAIVDTFVLDKEKQQNHKFSYIAMGVGAVLTMCLIYSLVTGGSSKNTTQTSEMVFTTTTIEETTTATTTAATTVATTTEANVDETAEASDENNDEGSDSGLVNPDLKAFLDSYEAYMDEYIAFMQKMSENPDDITIMAEYATMMTKYAEYADAIEKYDPDIMTEADRLYYLAVMARVEKKLLDASLTT